MTLEQQKEQLFKNGITIKDLEQEFKNGFEAGFHGGSVGIMETCFASFCLALQDVCGYDKEHILPILQRADEHIAKR